MEAWLNRRWQNHWKCLTFMKPLLLLQKRQALNLKELITWRLWIVTLSLEEIEEAQIWFKKIRWGTRVVATSQSMASNPHIFWITNQIGHLNFCKTWDYYDLIDKDGAETLIQTFKNTLLKQISIILYCSQTEQWQISIKGRYGSKGNYLIRVYIYIYIYIYTRILFLFIYIYLSQV